MKRRRQECAGFCSQLSPQTSSIDSNIWCRELSERAANINFRTGEYSSNSPVEKTSDAMRSFKSNTRRGTSVRRALLAVFAVSTTSFVLQFDVWTGVVANMTYQSAELPRCVNARERIEKIKGPWCSSKTWTCVVKFDKTFLFVLSLRPMMSPFISYGMKNEADRGSFLWEFCTQGPQKILSMGFYSCEDPPWASL